MMLNDIRQATGWLDASLRAAGVGQPTLRTAVSRISPSRQLGILLRSILDDPESLAEAAAQSYVHPLGFDKLVLATTPNFQLRLHVWWPGHGGTVEDVHNHRFPFGSSVLHGELEMRTFVRASDGLPMEEYEESAGTAVGDTRFRHVGEAALDCTNVAGIPMGLSYSLSAHELHRISVSRDCLTATLFLRGPTVSTATSVFSNGTSGDRSNLARPTMSRSVFADRLDAYLAALADDTVITSDHEIAVPTLGVMAAEVRRPHRAMTLPE
jgi:hypothetical protein